jgi:hypothetical protein|mmetsp:Transcript_1206/g.1928  ORF Transcript_1206/g.1928 Transcript_1206/m.1928 type:complete len:110 (+) Transcript_1206:1586-1915(+)
MALVFGNCTTGALRACWGCFAFLSFFMQFDVVVTEKRSVSGPVAIMMGRGLQVFPHIYKAMFAHAPSIPGIRAFFFVCGEPFRVEQRKTIDRSMIVSDHGIHRRCIFVV